MKFRKVRQKMESHGLVASYGTSQQESLARKKLFELIHKRIFGPVKQSSQSYISLISSTLPIDCYMVGGNTFFNNAGMHERAGC